MTGLAAKVAMATDMEESPSALILNQGHIVIFGIAGIVSPVIPPTHLPTASGVRKKPRSPTVEQLRQLWSGHWARYCPHRKDDKNTIPRKGPPSRSQSRSRAKSDDICNRCGQKSQWASGCPNNGGSTERSRGSRDRKGSKDRNHDTRNRHRSQDRGQGSKERGRGSWDRRSNSQKQRRQRSNSKDRSRSRSSAKPDDICCRCGGKGHHAKDCPTKL